MVHPEDVCPRHPHITGEWEGLESGEGGGFRQVEVAHSISSIESNCDKSSFSNWPLYVPIEEQDIGGNAISSYHCLECVDL